MGKDVETELTPDAGSSSATAEVGASVKLAADSGASVPVDAPITSVTQVAAVTPSSASTPTTATTPTTPTTDAAALVDSPAPLVGATGPLSELAAEMAASIPDAPAESVPVFARVDTASGAYQALESKHRVLDSAVASPASNPVQENSNLEIAASNVLEFVAERRAAARRTGDASSRAESESIVNIAPSTQTTTSAVDTSNTAATTAVESPDRLSSIVLERHAAATGAAPDLNAVKDARAELFLKTEKLLHFRLAFAATGLVLCVGLASFGTSDLDFIQLALLAMAVLVYSTAAIVLLERKFIVTRHMMIYLNAILVASDILVVTGMVHETKGFDSDLYVLYLLPILLSSFTFGRRGITASSFFVSVSYVCLLLWENASLLPYIMVKHQTAGLAAAYSQQLWRRILARSALLVSVTFIWGRFCEYMSGLETTEHQSVARTAHCKQRPDKRNGKHRLPGKF